MLALHSRENESRVGLADERPIGDRAEGKVRAKVGSGRVGEGECGGESRNGGELEHFSFSFYLQRKTTGACCK